MLLFRFEPTNMAYTTHMVVSARTVLDMSVLHDADPTAGFLHPTALCVRC